MKLLANLILMFAVIFGSLAATTAYLAPTTLPDEKLVGLTLNEDAGLLPDPANPGEMIPVAKKNTVLTAEILASIRANSFDAKGAPHTVKYLTVKEFQFDRWIGKWVFFASLAGLLLGAFLIRGAAKREIATAMTKSEGSAQSPEALLDSIAGAINTLRDDLHTMPSDDARLNAIVDRVGLLQRTDILDFIDARPIIVARQGMAGYAKLMGSFAAAERQINRAWSAAADRVFEESADSLDIAATLLEETKTKLA